MIHYDGDQLFSRPPWKSSRRPWRNLSRDRSPHPGRRVGLPGGDSRRRDRPAPGRRLDRFLAGRQCAVGQTTGGLDLKLLAPLALILFGLRRLWAAEKPTSPSWFDYLWFGFASFVMLNRGLVEGGSGPRRQKGLIGSGQGFLGKDYRQELTRLKD